MSIPVKVNNTQVLSFDIVTDDINITNLGNVSEVTEQSTPSLCTTADCYNCNQSQCNEVRCNQTRCRTTRCTQVKCTQVKCSEVKCNTVRCSGYDSHCNCQCMTDS